MGAVVTGVEYDDDPRRCKAVSGTRQCSFRAAEGFDYCNFHNSGQRLQLKKENERMYLLKRWRNEVNHFADHPQVKSLREELGILRLLLQETLNKCETPDDLQLWSGRMTELIHGIKDVTRVCQSMEEKTQFLVDKNQIVQLAEQILMIIAEYVTDTAILTKIADGVKNAIEAKAVITVSADGEIKAIDTPMVQ